MVNICELPLELLLEIFRDLADLVPLDAITKSYPIRLAVFAIDAADVLETLMANSLHPQLPAFVRLLALTISDHDTLKLGSIQIEEISPIEAFGHLSSAAHLSLHHIDLSPGTALVLVHRFALIHDAAKAILQIKLHFLGNFENAYPRDPILTIRCARR